MWICYIWNNKKESKRNGKKECDYGQRQKWQDHSEAHKPFRVLSEFYSKREERETEIAINIMEIHTLPATYLC